ncbi:MAG: hypothetical protein EP330_02165 [Deltaproteobacteria bacterium]|nr:MAG: hypothetical protein EP330_02165 [Deltaproteobacteria bacterium]
MALSGPKAQSVTVESTPDGWDIEPGYHGEMSLDAGTRLIVSAPSAQLAEVHQDLVRALAEPLSFLYRQKIDRRAVADGETPNTTLKPRDFIALDLSHGEVLAALELASDLVYHDARGEFWIRGGAGEQLVMDSDGILYAYPDDPSFRDVAEKHGLFEADITTLANRDYVKHFFHAEADVAEDALLKTLRLVEVPAQ